MVKIAILKKTLFFFIMLFSCPFFGQELLPFVENYNKSIYKGDNQVWNIVQGEDKAMYFANNKYFIRYDGNVWEKYRLPNNTVIRSVFSEGNRIYTGSYKEFGYWKREKGKMIYFSLSHDTAVFLENENEEIWKIFKHKGSIFFQSFNVLYVLKKGKVKKIPLPSLISYCFPIGEELYVATVENGIFKMKNFQFEIIPGMENLKNTVIHGIQKVNQQLFIFSQNKGVYVYQNKTLQAWNHPLNTVLKSAIINATLWIAPNKLLIGTGLQGLFLYDFKQNTYQNISKKNVLLNNSVLSMTLDAENDLWLGLDNGISHIEINSPIALLNDTSGVLGSVYSVVQTSPMSYLLASNHGVFNFQSNSIQSLPKVKGQAWDISALQNGFVIGHNNGTFWYDQNSGIKELNSENGGWNFVKSGVDSGYLQATYTGVVYYPNPNDLAIKYNIKGLVKPIKYVAQTSKNEIWAADNNRGLYRVVINDRWETVSVENITQQSKVKNDFGVKIFDFRNELLFLIDNNWYTYNSLQRKLELNELFQENFKNVSNVIALDDNQFLVIKEGVLYHIQSNANFFKWNKIREKYYRGKLSIDNIKVFKSNDHYLLNLDDGFMSIAFQNTKSTKEVPIIEVFEKDSLLEQGDKVNSNSELQVRVITGKYGYSRPNLFYSIDDGKEFVSFKDEGFTLTNLRSGSLFITIYFHDGIDFVKLNSFLLKVKYPWYLTFWMFLVYISVLGAMLFLYYKWNKMRYLQKLKLQEETLKYKNELMKMELKAQNELQYQEYEKHILELELQTKSSEVAGKSLSIAKQTEMMDKIQAILESETDVSKVKNEIKKIIKINSVNKHEWEAFETNLNHIHKEFISNLTAKYPKLTPKDIKLCIYLKMNLSSKEIAPMMNISFRGVELHRYRLRKKLQLQQDENLTKFLLNI